MQYVWYVFQSLLLCWVSRRVVQLDKHHRVSLSSGCLVGRQIQRGLSMVHIFEKVEDASGHPGSAVDKSTQLDSGLSDVRIANGSHTLEICMISFVGDILPHHITESA